MKAVLFMIVLFPLAAFAGKTEREYMKNEVKPAVEAAEKEFKAKCGCALKIKINESTFKSTDDMYQAKHTANGVKDGCGGHCTDDDSKKAVCKMKNLEIAKGKETKFEFNGSKGTAWTDGSSYTSFEMMTAQLDK